MVFSPSANDVISHSQVMKAPSDSSEPGGGGQLPGWGAVAVQGRHVPRTVRGDRRGRFLAFSGQDVYLYKLC